MGMNGGSGGRSKSKKSNLEGVAEENQERKLFDGLISGAIDTCPGEGGVILGAAEGADVRPFAAGGVRLLDVVGDAARLVTTRLVEMVASEDGPCLLPVG